MSAMNPAPMIATCGLLTGFACDAFQAQMLDVDHRPAGGAPGREQIGDPLFCVGVVPRSPARIVKALLRVDEEQGGAA
jgi:hypothetical protein